MTMIPDKPVAIVRHVKDDFEALQMAQAFIDLDGGVISVVHYPNGTLTPWYVFGWLPNIEKADDLDKRFSQLMYEAQPSSDG